MIFTETRLRGAYIIDIERKEDERGFFARTFCSDEFAARNLNADWVQCNISFNARRGTLRGMHYQVAPFAETKLVRCTLGAAYDVIVDLRAESETFRQWTAIELTAANRRSVYIPEGFAHGFKTLTDEVELFYQMSQVYRAECARGVRWDDPSFGIDWGDSRDLIINERDRTWADFTV